MSRMVPKLSSTKRESRMTHATPRWHARRRGHFYSSLDAFSFIPALTRGVSKTGSRGGIRQEKKGSEPAHSYCSRTTHRHGKKALASRLAKAGRDGPAAGHHVPAAPTAAASPPRFGRCVQLFLSLSRAGWGSPRGPPPRPRTYVMKASRAESILARPREPVSRLP